MHNRWCITELRWAYCFFLWTCFKPYGRSVWFSVHQKNSVLSTWVLWFMENQTLHINLSKWPWSETGWENFFPVTPCAKFLHSYELSFCELTERVIVKEKNFDIKSSHSLALNNRKKKPTKEYRLQKPFQTTIRWLKGKTTSDCPARHLPQMLVS